MSASRPIDRRFVPPVAGIDFVQSMNYLELGEVPASFLYESYTSSHLAYRRGSRPVLEAVATAQKQDSPLATVQALARFVADSIPWAGFYERDTGKRLPADRGLTEEAIIDQGYGWCNEQARVLCCLTQVLGIPSRLVFASNAAAHYGHVVTEVLLPAGWMLVDESFGYCFTRDGLPVRAADVYHDPANRAHFAPIYRKLCDDLCTTLGREILASSFRMSLADEPLDGFTDLGYHNHFVV